MNRRQALQSLAGLASVSLAGCSTVASFREDSNQQRTVRITAVDDVPDEYNVEMDVELLADTVTAEQTARLRITTTNGGRRRALSVGENMCSLFNRQDGGSDDPRGLWLNDPESVESIERKGDKWVRDRSSDAPRGYPAYACLPTVYEANESVSNEYVLWDDYRVPGYMDPGTNRWTQDVTIRKVDVPSDAEALGAFTWGFSLDVAIP